MYVFKRKLCCFKQTTIKTEVDPVTTNCENLATEEIILDLRTEYSTDIDRKELDFLFKDEN